MSLKKVLAALLAVSLVALVGCGGSGSGSSDTAKVLDPVKVADAMKTALAPQGELLAVEAGVVDNYYSIKDEVISGYKIYISTSFIAEEVAVFSVKEGKAEEAKKMLEQRLKDLKDSFDGYLPQELASLEANAKILTNGNLVCLLAGSGEGLAKAEKAFTDASN